MATDLQTSVKQQIRDSILKKNAGHEIVIKQADGQLVNDYPESAFIKFFLPMFSGQVETDPELLKQWEIIAGDLSRPVQLVDSAGLVVAKVPPVRSPLAFNHKAARSRSMANDMDLVDRGVVRDPAAHTYAAGVLRLAEMKKAGDNTQTKQQWINFLARYNSGPNRARDEPEDDIYVY